MTTRGVSLTRSRPLAPGDVPRPSGRTILLRATSEANFEDWVVRQAERYNWCGFHVRHSHASVRGVHCTKKHRHIDAYGWPDWVFYRDGGPMLFRELKSDSGLVTLQQRLTHQRLRAAGADVAVWRPSDEQLVIETFRRGG